MLSSFFQFIKSKTFLIHLALYLLCIIILFFIVTTWLKSTTNHGEYIKVPDFKGLKLNELDNFIEDKKVSYLVIDSIYDVKLPKGVVVRQEPEVGEDVKENRTIYLYVTSVLPPSMEMPKLVDRSLRQAVAMIASYGLKLGQTKFVPDQCANCILEQLVKGKKIAPGDVILKGTVVDLVVGKGLSDEQVAIPCFYGYNKKEALEKLSEYSLSLGVIVYDTPKDSASSFIYRQSPGCGDNTVSMGTSIDLYFTADKNKIPAKQAESTKENGFD